jgi:hypothetical protein
LAGFFCKKRRQAAIQNSKFKIQDLENLAVRTDSQGLPIFSNFEF